MLIRIHELAEDGRPVRYTGEYLEGVSALAIIERMLINPFCTDKTPRDFMERVLRQIGHGGFPLVDNEADAADDFVTFLEKEGYVEVTYQMPEYETREMVEKK